MRPKGKLRPAIQDLARRNGAYVIVSSGASVTDTRPRSRKPKIV
jgi:trehalose-6-phosphatase